MKAKLADEIKMDEERTIPKLLMDWFIVSWKLQNKKNIEEVSKIFQAKLNKIIKDLFEKKSLKNYFSPSTAQAIVENIFNFFMMKEKKHKDLWNTDDFMYDVRSFYNNLELNSLNPLALSWSSVQLDVVHKLKNLLSSEAYKNIGREICDFGIKQDIDLITQKNHDPRYREALINNMPAKALNFLFAKAIACLSLGMLLAYYTKNSFGLITIGLGFLYAFLVFVLYMIINRAAGKYGLGENLMSSSIFQDKYYRYLEFILIDHILWEKSTDIKKPKIQEKDTQKPLHISLPKNNSIDNKRSSELDPSNIYKKAKIKSRSIKEKSGKKEVETTLKETPIKQSIYKASSLKFFVMKEEIMINNYLSSRYHPRVRQLWKGGKYYNLYLVFTEDLVACFIKDKSALEIFMNIIKTAHWVNAKGYQGMVKVDEDNVKAKTLDSQYGKNRLLFTRMKPVEVIPCDEGEQPEEVGKQNFYLPCSYDDDH